MDASATTVKKMPGTKPVQVFREGDLSASVFANQHTLDGKTRTFFKVSFQKTYKKGDQLKRTQSFGRDDLPKLMDLIGEAAAFIGEQENAAPENAPQ